MAEKKQILLEIKTDMAKSIEELTELNRKLADLRAEQVKIQTQMNGLSKTGQENTDKFRELERQLTANNETQKAYRKEIQSVSHELQNSIIAEGKYADTLKGKSAQLANEKKILREIKIANGELSQEYKNQQKKVADLNAEVLELERAYGTHTRNVGNYESAWGGMLGKLKIGWAALIAAVLAGLKEFGEDFIKMTQRTGDMFKFEVQGWKDAYAAFIVSLQRGDGWRELIDNISSAYTEGKKFAQMLDEIFERENSLRIEEAAISAENEQLKIDMRDRTKSDEERIAAAQKMLDNEKKIADMRKDIAEQERDANKGRLQERTKMTDEELSFYVKQYNINKDIIRQAIEYNKEIRERENLIASLQQQQSMSTAGAGGFGTSSRAQRIANNGVSIQDQIKTAQDELADIQAQASDGLKEVAAIAAKYALTNDDLVKAYVESEIKSQTVYSDMLSRTARAQTTMHSLQNEIAQENERNAEREKQKKERSEEEQKKIQEKSLKEQAQAIASYITTINKLYDQLDDARLSDSEKQKKAVRKQYEEQTQLIAKQAAAGLMSFEEATYYRVMLARQAAQDIQAIEEDAKDKQRAEEKKRLEEESKARRDQLQTDLQIAWENAEEQFRIKKEYLEKELEVAGLTAEKEAELQQQLTELIRTHLKDRMSLVSDYVSQLESAFGAINQIANNDSKARIQDAEEENEAEKKSLEKRLKAGLVSQKQYDDKVEKMDAELAQKKAEETRKQAERDKALAMFQAAINTATAIVKVWTDVPTMLAPAFTAVVAAVGALQMAAIASEPLPKAAKGGKIKGATHEQGGVLLETENEERIVAANPAKAFPELLNLISYIGKNAGVANTGFAQRYEMREAAGNNAEIDYDRLIEGIGDKVVEGVRNLQIWLSLTELHDAEQNVARLDELAKQ